jgi:hypothetical protein
MGDDLLDGVRHSHIQLDGRYVDYPLQFPADHRILIPGLLFDQLVCLVPLPLDLEAP